MSLKETSETVQITTRTWELTTEDMQKIFEAYLGLDAPFYEWDGEDFAVKLTIKDTSKEKVK